LRHAISGEADVIINVVDATVLSRSLEFTLQLMQLGKPIVICLNMMDEAEHKGLQIQVDKLSEKLGIPIIPTVASRGIGVSKVFSTALKVAKNPSASKPILPLFSSDVEEAISSIIEAMPEDFPQKFKDMKIDKRFLAIKLLEQDEFFWNKIRDNRDFIKRFKSIQSKIEADRGMPSDLVIASERHAISMAWFEETVTVVHAEISLAHKMDDLLMHPYFGYLIAAGVLYLFFMFVFTFGNALQEPLLTGFNRYIIEPSVAYLGKDTLTGKLVNGLLQGIAGGLTVNLPYVLPLLIGLAFLEDTGYLPRAAFMLDTFMHRMGLHGKAVFPMLLGYGCSVPAIMATRIMESRRDRIITSSLVLLIPCSGRTIVILGLVGYYMGMNAALSIYLLNLLVIVIVGFVISHLKPEVTPGMILEIPELRWPVPKITLLKIWLRLKEFLIVAWPLLIISSIILSLMDFYGFTDAFNAVMAPLTSTLLGLPTSAGTPLILSILRKELALIMLSEALGTWNLSDVLTETQMFTFAVFTTFFIPCFTSLGMIAKELGWKTAVKSAFLTLIIAVILATLTRLLI